MAKSLTELRAEGAEVFVKLFDPSSAVRRFSEAGRENSAKTYSPEDADEAFEAMIDRALDQHDAVEESFASQPPKE